MREKTHMKHHKHASPPLVAGVPRGSHRWRAAITRPIRTAVRVLTAAAALIAAGRAECAADSGRAPPVPATLILQWTHQAQFAGYYMALEKGIYAAHGLDVTILRGGPDRDQVAYLLDGRADFATRWLASALADAASGAPIKHIAQIINRSNLVLVAWKDSGIAKVSDLDGRRVGVWEGQFRPPFVTFFRAHGIAPVIVQQNYSINLFLRRGVDACSAMYYNEYHMLYQAGVDMDELLVFPLACDERPFPEDGIYCMRETFEKKPEACRAMAKASIMGWRYAAEHPEEAIDVVIRYAREAKVPANRPHTRWMLDAMLDSIFPGQPAAWTAGILSPEAYAGTVEMMIGHGMITNAPAFRDFTAQESPDVP